MSFFLVAILACAVFWDGEGTANARIATRKKLMAGMLARVLDSKDIEFVRATCREYLLYAMG
jgi:hypothetical protein